MTTRGNRNVFNKPVHVFTRPRSRGSRRDGTFFHDRRDGRKPRIFVNIIDPRTHLFHGVVRGAGHRGQPPQVVEGAHAADRVRGPRRVRRQRVETRQVHVDEGAGEVEARGQRQLARVRPVRPSGRVAQRAEPGDGRRQTGRPVVRPRLTVADART